VQKAEAENSKAANVEVTLAAFAFERGKTGQVTMHGVRSVVMNGAGSEQS
jgi:hypothetical protein